MAAVVSQTVTNDRSFVNARYKLGAKLTLTRGSDRNDLLLSKLFLPI